jgi:hypothetical protein
MAPRGREWRHVAGAVCVRPARCDRLRQGGAKRRNRGAKRNARLLHCGGGQTLFLHWKAFMDTENLKQSLKQLQARLDATADVDPELRALLQSLDGDIRQLLARDAAADAAAVPDGNRLLEQAQALGARFAVRHPHLEPALREVADALARMGI